MILRLNTLLIVLLTASLLLVIGTKPTGVDALSGASWQAGRIIDDVVFTDKYSMSVAQIQQFLNQKVGTGGYGRVPGQCDTNGVASSEYGGGTRAQYGAANGNPTPFTCLKDFYEVPKTTPGPGIPANNYGGKPIPTGAKSAAQIIYDAAQTYNISPKVLLVTIEKESAGPLITDDWPFNSQYTYAMGAHCPDGPNGANCDPNYAGFSMQIYDSADLLRYYLDNMQQSWWPYKKPYQINNILWQVQYKNGVATNCGGSDVYIQNKATAALYTYTPYQPNQAALNNLYGTGDYCSAYGNRNFWRIYNDWFGLPTAPEYRAQAAGQSPVPYIKQGASLGMYARFRNTGNQTWYDDISAYANGKKPVRLGTDLDLNHPSVFASGWAYPHRPGINFARVYDENGAIKSGAHVALPGETVEFWFAYKAPHNLPARSYMEGFRPIVEGLGPMNNTGSYFTVNVTPAIYSAKFVDQSSFPDITQNQRASVFIRYKNTGNVSWYDETSAPGSGQLPIHLATDYPLNRNSVLASFWPYKSRAAINFSAVFEADGTTPASNQHLVKPGQVVRFSFDVMASAAATPSFYREGLRPVVQGLGPMNDTGTWMGVNVKSASYLATFVGQSNFPTIARGNSAAAYFLYKNTGNVSWYDNSSAWAASQPPVRLGTDNSLNRLSIFGSNWSLGASRASSMFDAVFEADGTTPASNQHLVKPGQVVRFSFSFTVPSGTSLGYYPEAFRPIVEGFGPMNNVGTFLGVTVTD